MYIETSPPNKKGYKAWITSPLFKDKAAVCLQFYYHMFGDGIGSLNVYAQVSNFDACLKNMYM